MVLRQNVLFAKGEHWKMGHVATAAQQANGLTLVEGLEMQHRAIVNR